MLIANQQRIDFRNYGDETVLSESVVYNHQWSTNDPVFMTSELHLDTLRDETDLFTFVPHIHRLMHLSFGHQAPSSWIFYPTKYKFFGFQINLSDRE